MSTKSRPVHDGQGVDRLRPGPVMIIGGAEDKLRDKVILGRFTSLAGGEGARIAVISTASSLGDVATDLYRQLFEAMGCADVRGLRPLTREEASDQAAADSLDGLTGIFLTGGNQLRLSSVVGGTALGAAILRAHERGVVVAGTSAGASAVSTHMIAFGASGATPKHRMAQVSAGLGLLKNVVVDQHFEQRTRLGRLLAIVAQSPSLIGLGLDEDTAAVVDAGNVLEVMGKGSVTIVDGSKVVTDSYQTKGHRPMMVSGAVVHTLPAGFRFDLSSRTLVSVEPLPTPRDTRLREAAQPSVDRRLRRLSRAVDAEGARSFESERPASRGTGDRKASE